MRNLFDGSILQASGTIDARLPHGQWLAAVTQVGGKWQQFAPIERFHAARCIIIGCP